jgi:hypothetical protein
MQHQQQTIDNTVQGKQKQPQINSQLNQASIPKRQSNKSHEVNSIHAKQQQLSKNQNQNPDSGLISEAL